MNSERTILQKLKGIAPGVPSILSNNRTAVAVLAFLYLLPLSTSAGTSPVRTLLYLVTQIMIFGLLAMSFDLQLGRSALLNFGHVAFFGVGAYFMAFTLDAGFFPEPYNAIAAIPYPFTLILAMLLGGFLGLIMGLTTNRMRGTAFAFIALAFSMFLYNFFAENPDISGGETGLGVPTPAIMRTAPFYLLFVSIAFVFLAAFIGMIILYLKKRTDSIGLLLFTPIMIVLTAVLLIFGDNIYGPILVFYAFLGIVFLYWMERKRSISDPMQFSEKTQTISSGVNATNKMTVYAIPFIIILIALIGLVATFGTNISQMVSLWIEDTSTYYYTIPVQFYVVLTCLVMTYFFIKRLIASPFGRMVTAVAQNEERAEALGYNSFRAKIVVLVISGAIAALAGALYAPYLRVIDPITALGVEVTINAMLYAIIGGIGTLFGPILGTGVVVYSELNIVDFITEGLGLPGELWLIGLGVMYIFIVLFMPFGIVGSIGRRANSVFEKTRQIKLGRFEFAIKSSDYWIFGFLGTVGLFLFLIEDARLLPIVVGTFGFLVIFVLLLLWLYRKEIVSRFRSLPKAIVIRTRSIIARILAIRR
ncbi:MAG: branched-chain amino acid ABC transporter permease [Candidatus Thorarchaeota archaeon]